MSRFSNKLKVLIEDSGTNVYQLAKKAQLDRTTIQRAIVGERLPSVIFVEKLCDYLRVSPMERKELLEFHAISKVGEDVYASRNYIKGMIERFETIHTKTDLSLIHISEPTRLGMISYAVFCLKKKKQKKKKK